jgi:hypothetical protein
MYQISMKARKLCLFSGDATFCALRRPRKLLRSSSRSGVVLTDRPPNTALREHLT